MNKVLIASALMATGFGFVNGMQDSQKLSQELRKELENIQSSIPSLPPYPENFPLKEGGESGTLELIHLNSEGFKGNFTKIEIPATKNYPNGRKFLDGHFPLGEGHSAHLSLNMANKVIRILSPGEKWITRTIENERYLNVKEEKLRVSERVEFTLQNRNSLMEEFAKILVARYKKEKEIDKVDEYIIDDYLAKKLTKFEF